MSSEPQVRNQNYFLSTSISAVNSLFGFTTSAVCDPISRKILPQCEIYFQVRVYVYVLQPAAGRRTWSSCWTRPAASAATTSTWCASGSVRSSTSACDVTWLRWKVASFYNDDVWSLLQSDVRDEDWSSCVQRFRRSGLQLERNHWQVSLLHGMDLLLLWKVPYVKKHTPQKLFHFYFLSINQRCYQVRIINLCCCFALHINYTSWSLEYVCVRFNIWEWDWKCTCIYFIGEGFRKP